MLRDDLQSGTANLPADIPGTVLKVNAEKWFHTSESLRESGARLLALWGADDRDRDHCFRVYAMYLLPQTTVLAALSICDTISPHYRSLATIFPVAHRMQRAVYDLLGISTEELDTRGWLRHGGWPESVFPLRRDCGASQEYSLEPRPYSFVTVEGDGVHEIAVGPVHAGIIEPGHFRFSVVGEHVLRLEERLGYTHKGIEKQFEGIQQADGHRLAARVSGDSAVAFSWAYCAALENITKVSCPPRAASLRALALEHERMANHLGDLGALGNDAGFAFGLTQFSKMKEDLLRANELAFGARYLFDYVVPGGVIADLSDGARGPLLDLYFKLDESVSLLRKIYDNHAGLQDRFREAGRLPFAVATELGAIGLAGRASGIEADLRVDHPWPPYDHLRTNLVSQTSGDVAARVQVRFDEIFESLRLCRELLHSAREGPISVPLPMAAEGKLGIGLIEGWRGPVMVALETGKDGGIRRCHPHDPSWQNWPLIEHAILGNIVPDFPLINKSFNLSYSGQDG
jgi:Ni,Fe-hydrogenase III large subunit/Ni,Fe-hydrogenase III component G